MMSEACFDPRQAVELWKRMEKEEENAPPQFLSTHPSNHNRILAITNWLEEAERKHEQVSVPTLYFTHRAMADTFHSLAVA